MPVARVVTDEVYDTQPLIAKQCIQDAEEQLKNISTRYYIEPSAGCGNFSKQIPQKQLLFAGDIAPRHPSIQKFDFLRDTFPSFPGTNAERIIIGNPPFGYQKLIIFEFMKRALEIADTICFILPYSFTKRSTQAKLPPHLHLVYERVLPKYCFIREKRRHPVACVFQIWKRLDIPRVNRPYFIPGHTLCKIPAASFPTADPFHLFMVYAYGQKAGLACLYDGKSYDRNCFYFTTEKPLEAVERINAAQLSKRGLRGKHLIPTISHEDVCIVYHRVQKIKSEFCMCDECCTLEIPVDV